MPDALAALLRLTDAIGAAQSLDEIFAHAVDGLRAATGIDRASIAIHDRAGRLRLVASRGLSAELCAALEREPLTETAEIADVEQEPSLAAHLAQMRAESIGALATIPLRHGAELLGHLTLYMRGPHRFDPQELKSARLVASHITLAIIHARRRAELADAKDELETVFANITEGIAVHNADGSVRYLNDAAAKAVGFASAEALIGRPHAHVAERFDFIAEDGRPLAPAELPGRRVRDTKSSIRQTVGARLRSTGEVRWFDENAAPVLDEAGEIRFIVLALREVTEYRRAMDAAREAEQRKDEFLAILGHELRNPLSPIVTALQLMEMDGGPHFSRERAIIGRQVRHMLRLVDDLLDVSRITRGKLELQRASLDVREIVRRAVETVSPLLEQRRHRLSLELGTQELLVDGDSVRLGQVLGNLLTNAAKYTEPGGELLVRAERKKAQIVVTIEDNGIGIDPQLMPHLFELFVQGGQALDRSRGGLGLGLTIVRRIVELHGGSVHLHSDGPGRGTSARVELPIATLRSSRPPSTPHLPFVGPNAALGAVRVLVVDDNGDAADTIATSLSAIGYRTSVAYDGPSAIEKAASFEPHVVVLDIGLPVMDGYEVARRLRRSRADLRLVAVTGYGQAGDRDRAHAAGFDAHLVKPVDLGALLAALRPGR